MFDLPILKGVQVTSPRKYFTDGLMHNRFSALLTVLFLTASVSLGQVSPHRVAAKKNAPPPSVAPASANNEQLKPLAPDSPAVAVASVTSILRRERHKAIARSRSPKVNGSSSNTCPCGRRVPRDRNSSRKSRPMSHTPKVYAERSGWCFFIREHFRE